MTRSTHLGALLAVMGLYMGSQAHAQSPAIRPAFEVATVKLNTGWVRVSRAPHPRSRGTLSTFLPPRAARSRRRGWLQRTTPVVLVPAPLSGRRNLPFARSHRRL